MVRSDRGKQVEIKIQPVNDRGESLTYHPQAVTDSVIVNWGRDSLYNAPRNRTASVTIGIAAHGFQPGWWLNRKLSITVGDMLIFMGAIDRVKNHHFTSAAGVAFLNVEFNAVEGGLFDPVLMKERDIKISNNRDFVTPWAEDMRAASIGIQMQYDRPPVFMPFYEPVRLTLKRSLELALESAQLLTWAEWMPNHQHVHPTLYRLWPTAPPTEYFPASNVEVSDAEATLEKTPKGWGVWTGGEYGNKTPWVYRDRFPKSMHGPREELTSPVQWNHGDGYNSSLFEQTMRLATYLQADPQHVTIIDGGKQRLNTTAHLRTWETPTHGVKFTGQLDGPRFIDPKTGKFDPMRAQDLHTDDWWYPIGGQLRITPDLTTHRWNAIKLIPEDRGPTPMPR